MCNKSKIYKDDEYTQCTFCKKAITCKDVIKCFKCGKTSCIFYYKRLDIFTCSKCLYETEA